MNDTNIDQVLRLIKYRENIIKSRKEIAVYSLEDNFMIDALNTLILSIEFRIMYYLGEYEKRSDDTYRLNLINHVKTLHELKAWNRGRD